MAQVLFKGSTIQLEGRFPESGEKAPDFRLVGDDLSERSLEDFKAQNKILITVPSLDTPVCAKETKVFHEKVQEIENTVVLVISSDLPFAMKRFCGVEGVNNIIPLSQFRSPDFAKSYGVHIAEGPLRALAARAVFLVDSENTICYTELVDDIGKEPDYDRAIDATRSLKK